MVAQFSREIGLASNNCQRSLAKVGQEWSHHDTGEPPRQCNRDFLLEFEADALLRQFAFLRVVEKRLKNLFHWYRL
jgi:hypothetical protein